MPTLVYKQQSILLWFFEIIMMIVVLVLSSINIYSNRQSLIFDAKNSTKALASFAMADAERLVYGVTIMFPGINDVLENKKEGVEDFDSKISKILISRKEDNPYLMDLLVVNEQGAIIQWTGSGKLPEVLDREYVSTHLNALSTKEIYIGKPKLSKVHENQWFFAVSKAYYHQDGSLKRILVAIVDIQFLYGHYLQLDLPEQASVVLASLDGMIYTRIPDHQRLVGKQVEELAEFGRSEQQIKVFQTISPLDNLKRVVTFYKNAHYPLISIVSFSEQEVLKPWKQQTLITLFIAALFLLLLSIIIKKLNKYQHYLYQQGITEGLSGLYNRSYFYYQANLEIKKALRYKTPLSFIMVDIDDFKKINDTWGHLAGDKLIAEISSILKSHCRSSDIVARYGGEEFIIMLSNSDITGAYKMAELLRDYFQNKQVNYQDSCFDFTASFGISTLENENTIEQLIDKADKALYQAKNTGKNKVMGL